MTVSVALAAYNGEEFIEEQINSILSQLSAEDEIVISLDPSTDGTREMICFISEKDPRVKLFDGMGRGVIKNFENAIEHCKNDIIFLCDQDDIWLDGKVERVKKEFENPETVLVMHDAKIVDRELNTIEKSFFEQRKSGTGIVKNLIKNTYIGCCMAFRGSCCEYLLPIPENIPMHDQWIGLMCERHGKIALINEPLILYRRHGDNVSSDKHSSVLNMIKWRLQMISALLKR